jgi:hypothetical protein
VDPEIGQHIYRWVRDGKVVCRGLKAAELLLSRPLEAIAALKASGIIGEDQPSSFPGSMITMAAEGMIPESRFGDRGYCCKIGFQFIPGYHNQPQSLPMEKQVESKIR